jgi:hypothetical protein
MRSAEKTKKREANLMGLLVELRKANTGVLRCLPVDLAQTVLISGHILAFGNDTAASTFRLYKSFAGCPRAARSVSIRSQ